MFTRRLVVLPLKMSSPKRPKLEEFENMPELPKRSWLDVNTGGSVEGARRTGFRILQFNTLADALAHTSFIKCPAAALKWSYRRQSLLQEILRADPDILCLEEVDHYSDFFKPELTKHGYEGTFLPKPDSPCLYFPENVGPDGCALFYRSSKFELVKKKELVLRNTEGGDSNQVAILGELRLKDEKRNENSEEEETCQERSPLTSIFISVTHLKAKEGSEKLRMAQGRHLIEEMSSFSPAGAPVVMAGDFNGTPKEEVYTYFSESESHPSLRLKSSYKGMHFGGNEPDFTSWKFRAAGEMKYTIDYIWYCPQSLCVERVWDTPKEEDIRETGLPCKAYPSDHVALCTEFSLTS